MTLHRTAYQLWPLSTHLSLPALSTKHISLRFRTKYSGLSPFITGNTHKDSFNTRSQWLSPSRKHHQKWQTNLSVWAHILPEGYKLWVEPSEDFISLGTHRNVHRTMQLAFLQPCVGRMTAVNVSDMWDFCGRQPGAHDEIILTNLRGNWVSFHHLHSSFWIPSWLCWLSSHESNSVNFLIKLKRKLLLLGQVLLCTYCYYLSLSTYVILEEGKMREKIRECVLCSHSIHFSF